jgi:hypothetical protein
VILKAPDIKEAAMWKLLILAGLVAGGYIAYKRLTRMPEDDWDDDIMYESAELHEAEGAPATPTV